MGLDWPSTAPNLAHMPITLTQDMTFTLSPDITGLT